MHSHEDENTADGLASKSTSSISTSSALVTAGIARRAEHRCLSVLSKRAEQSETLEVTRPSVTNCPDAGHDIDVRGGTKEVKELVGELTAAEPDSLAFLDGAAEKGQLQVRIDVKSGNTVTADMIDGHAANSSRSPTFQVNLLLVTNPDVKITKEAKKKLAHYQSSFKEIGVLIDVTRPECLERMEARNRAVAPSALDAIEVQQGLSKSE